jgi:3-oxoacyl-[acyl-carrier protein] reductase
MRSEKPLDGKVALITGASRGIGLAIAHRLAALGASLGLSARDRNRLDAVASGFASGIKVFAVPADLTSTDQIAALVPKTEQALGPIDILVNNAGVGTFAPIQDASERDWDSMLDTNLKAVFLLTRLVAAGMIRRKTGHIVNIASLAGKNAFAGGAVYCASKWGLLGLTQCAAEDLRAYGIRVSAVCPGSVATEFSPHGKKDPARMLQAEDVAHAVEAIVTQAPQSFISEISVRPTQKP